MEQQKAAENGGTEEPDHQLSFASSILGQLGAIQDNFTNQLSELSGNLPDAGPLSAAFRKRVKHSMYLLFASITFGALAIVVGLPTLVLRPSKFVICMSLSTLCGAGSVIVLQKPTTFLSSLLNDGPSKSLPVVLLLVSMVVTIYVAVFIHKYVFVVVAGGAQIGCMLFYLASFIPGGSRGLQVLLRMGYAIIKTALTPCFFVAKKAVGSFVRTVMS
jgi:hypothetical protein